MIDVTLDDGRVFSFGRNNRGQLGLGDKTARSTPTIVTAFHDETIVAAAMGSFHTIFLDSNGRVYSCGRNADGELGLGDKTGRSIPTLLADAFDGKRVVDVATNLGFFCFARCFDGMCFVILTHLICRLRLWLGL